MPPQNHTFLDAHLHLYPPKRLSGLIRWMHSFFPTHPVPKDATLDDVLEDLRQHDYRNFVALVFPLKPEESPSLNSFIAEMATRTPGLVPFGCVHVSDSSPAAVVEDAVLRLKVAGLKFHPMVQRFDPCDSRLFPVFERMDEWRKPIYIHTGFDDWYGFNLPVKSLRTLLGRFPNIPFVFCHMLFPKVRTAFELLEEFPNLHLDATNVFGTIALFRQTLADEMPELDLDECREEMELHCRRIMFGTDHPAGMGDIQQILDDAYAFGLSENANSYLLQKTAAAFLSEHCATYCIGEYE
jgi:predicted TIM-barrel fold metal-dependent hydrolase